MSGVLGFFMNRDLKVSVKHLPAAHQREAPTGARAQVTLFPYTRVPRFFFFSFPPALPRTILPSSTLKTLAANLKYSSWPTLRAALSLEAPTAFFRPNMSGRGSSLETIFPSPAIIKSKMFAEHRHVRLAMLCCLFCCQSDVSSTPRPLQQPSAPESAVAQPIAMAQ
jgi:hypothetical protein